MISRCIFALATFVGAVISSCIFGSTLCIGVYIVLLMGFNLYMNLFTIPEAFFEWSLRGLSRVLLVLGTILWISLLSRTIIGFIKEIRMVKANL